MIQIPGKISKRNTIYVHKNWIQAEVWFIFVMKLNEIKNSSNFDECLWTINMLPVDIPLNGLQLC